MAQHVLNAWFGRRHAGELRFDDETALFAFDYDVAWRDAADGFYLAPPLPLHGEARSAELQSATVRRFFENLLPEGRALDDVAGTYALSKGNLFGLMRVLGRESAGALMLLPPGDLPVDLANSRREITPAELSGRIRDRARLPFSVWDGKVRLSIAGHQDKLAVYRSPDGRLSLVEGQWASTHILKPDSANPSLPYLVANEHFCMRLAAILKLPVAPVEIQRVPEPILLVGRFDRKDRGELVERIHIIDGCQALNLPVDYKYERIYGNAPDVANMRGGASLEKLFSLAPLSPVEALMRQQMMRWVLLQYLIGNSDAHGKNLSCFVTPAGLTLAPAYDLVCVRAYPEMGHRLAMAIGDEFDLDRVTAFDWAVFAQSCGLDRGLLSREMGRMVKGLRKAVPQLLADPVYHDAERTILRDVADVCLLQADRLEVVSRRLPGVRNEDL